LNFDKVIIFLLVDSFYNRNINTIFGQLKLIKLNAIPSTNSYLKEMAQNESIQDGIVVLTNSQTRGRGQQGSGWISQDGKSLTFSVFKVLQGLDIDNSFYLQCKVSLAIYDTLLKYDIPNLAIKWPNDIMAGSKKICGILIENQVRSTEIKSAIIGIGLNVNDIFHPDIPKATSMFLETDTTFNRDDILKEIVQNININFKNWDAHTLESQFNKYHEKLFRKGKISVFKKQDELFNAIIKGVSTKGLLQVEIENSTIQEYYFKEVALLS